MVINQKVSIFATEFDCVVAAYHDDFHLFALCVVCFDGLILR